MKKTTIILLLLLGGVAYYHFDHARKRREVAAEAAYVLPEQLPVWDTTAVIRRMLVTLHGGEEVHVAARIGKWAKLLLPGGATGWVEQKDLIDTETYERGQNLLKELTRQPPQAAGHTDAAVNLHLDASRDALKLAEFPANQPLEVYNRRLVARTEPGGTPARNPIRDVWYLVRSGKRAGWILGRFVDLDVPPGLESYAQGVNMVAWQVLDTVNDGGRQVPQYVAADRIGVRNPDFNHVRVFTWWIKHHKYVTAYVESGLEGYFPITVTHSGGTPYFRLRLLDDEGHKYQKVYGLFDTITKVIGTVDGWESDAMPAPPPSRHRGLRRKRRRR